MVKISIITVVKNNKAGLLRAINCVRGQTYKNIEHIIVDGGSTDGSVEAIKNESVIPANEVSQESKSDYVRRRNDANSNNSELPTSSYQLLSISEPDNGIYDAINKGIKLATGDVIGLLHSDDLYSDEKVLERYAEAFKGSSSKTKEEVILNGMKDLNSPRDSSSSTQNDILRQAQDDKVDAVYSDLVYVKKKSEARSEKSDSRQAEMTRPPTSDYQPPTPNFSIVRNWKTHKSVSSNQNSVNSSLTDHHSLITENLLRKGWMPPHPTLFIRREIFKKFGFYRTDMSIAADYEMILRLLFKHKITTNYLPLTTYIMSIGGASNRSIRNILQKSKEDYRAMKLNGISYPLFTLLFKNTRKLPQFLVRGL